MTDPRPALLRNISRGPDLHPLVQLTLARVREFLREPEAVFWAIFFPILLAAALGIAFRSNPAEVLKVAVTDAELAAALRQDPALDVQHAAEEAALRALNTGKVALLASVAQGEVVYRYDDANPEARTARMIADRAIQRARGRVDPVAARDDLVREPGSRYIDFVVPGLVGLGIMSNAVWGLGFSIVDARRRKLTKRLVATPMPRSYYLLSYLVWRMMILPVEVGVPIGFGVLVFSVPVRGALIDLAIVAIASSLSFSALGLLIACRARTIEAASGLMNLVQIPMWILSGVFFSAQRFPDAVQPLIRALPLTATIDALRMHMLEGASLLELRSQLAVLAVWAIVCFGVAMKLFRWR